MKPLPFVATGVANTASVRAAFARLGRELVPATLVDVQAPAALVLPGVGHFAAAMRVLQRLGFVEPLRQRMQRGAPTLGICLGMQLCCEGSDEAPGIAGIGVVAGTVRRFGPDVRCPQMGWNGVAAPAGAGLLRTGHAYFANSYALPDAPAGWRYATTDHGQPFVSALERDAVLLCQFHPELSGAYGRDLLAGWLARADAASSGEASC